VQADAETGAKESEASDEDDAEQATEDEEPRNKQKLRASFSPHMQGRIVWHEEKGILLLVKLGCFLPPDALLIGGHLQGG